jgi:hypothetical protein
VYICDWSALPHNTYGQWNVSALVDEDLAVELHLHLQSRGKYIAMHNIQQYLNDTTVLECFSLKKNISLATTTHWMKIMEYQWQKEPSGQYVDGHEHNDIVTYQNNVMLPFWEKIEPTMQWWDEDGYEINAKQLGQCTMVWTLIIGSCDGFIHLSQQSPCRKVKGVSLMVSDFASANYG